MKQSRKYGRNTLDTSTTSRRLGNENGKKHRPVEGQVWN